MVPVERAVLAQSRSYLHQADGVLVVSLKAGEDELPCALQNALWAAAVLIEEALAVAEDLDRADDSLVDSDAI